MILLFYYSIYCDVQYFDPLGSIFLCGLCNYCYIYYYFMNVSSIFYYFCLSYLFKSIYFFIVKFVNNCSIGTNPSLFFFSYFIYKVLWHNFYDYITACSNFLLLFLVLCIFLLSFVYCISLILLLLSLVSVFSYYALFVSLPGFSNRFFRCLLRDGVCGFFIAYYSELSFFISNTFIVYFVFVIGNSLSQIFIILNIEQNSTKLSFDPDLSILLFI